MRILIVAAVLAAASPAVAQSPVEMELRFQQEAAARRAVTLTNELTVLESRVRTEQALSDLRLSTAPVYAPQLPYAVTPVAPAAAAKYPSVPDAVLADSNRRVREASQPRR